jgi:hypothetical protein
MGIFGWLVTAIIIAFVVGILVTEIRNRRQKEGHPRHLPAPDQKSREAKRDSQKGEDWGL